MQIKLDENLSRYLKPLLEQEGHGVSTAEEEGLLGKDDLQVHAAAKSEGRVLFTLDIGFADLRRHPPGGHPGIVVFRPRSMGPNTVNAFVLNFVRRAELPSLQACVVVVDARGVRVRRPASNTNGE